MRVWNAAAWAALGLVLVAGCSKSGGAANTASPAAPTGGAASPAAGGPDVTIAAADMPHLKAGYWEQTTTTNGSGPEVHRYCSSGKPVSAPAQMGKGCSTFAFKRTVLGAFVIDADCAEGPVSSKMHMTASGDFNANFASDSQVSIVMQGRPASTFTTHTVSRWIGPCPAGAAPED